MRAAAALNLLGQCRSALGSPVDRGADQVALLTVFPSPRTSALTETVSVIETVERRWHVADDILRGFGASACRCSRAGVDGLSVD